MVSRVATPDLYKSVIRSCRTVNDLMDMKVDLLIDLLKVESGNDLDLLTVISFLQEDFFNFFNGDDFIKNNGVMFTDETLLSIQSIPINKCNSIFKRLCELVVGKGTKELFVKEVYKIADCVIVGCRDPEGIREFCRLVRIIDGKLDDHLCVT